MSNNYSPIDASFDPAAAFQTSQHPMLRMSSAESYAALDEAELIREAKAQLKAPRKKLARIAKSQVAMQVLTSDGDTNFAERMAEVLKQKGFPTVEIEYHNLTVEADALVGDASDPTVWNAFKSMGKKLVGSSLLTKPVKVLDGVSGVIKPGTLTLVLGPPGAGKTVLMQLLSGRLHAHKALRVDGTIKYNGEEMDSFVVQRTAGLVDQYDNNIPNLTVLETLKFAAACQIPEEEKVSTLVALDKAEAALMRKHRDMDAEVAAAVAAEEGGGGSVTPRTEGTSTADGTTAGASSTASPSSASSDPETEFLDLMRQVVLQGARPYIVMHLLGLAHTANTFVGNETLRGVSGGERKRVTSAEVLTGPQWALFMDEISTGLDSATTFTVIRSLREICHSTCRTIAISLLQPEPEVMGLFDDLLLLTDGKVIYHGPIAEAVSFFSSLGFVCPPRKDPGSFLQEVTTPMGQMSYAAPEMLDSHGVPAEERDPAYLLENPPKVLLMSVEEMAAAFWETPRGMEMRHQLEMDPYDAEKRAVGPGGAYGGPWALARTPYARSGVKLALLALQRQLLLVRRDKAFYIARVVQAIIMGLMISSLFASVGPPSTSDPSEIFSQGRKVIAMMVISALYLSMSSMPTLGFVMQTKRVFYKHRDNRFFPSWSYSVALFLAQLPSATVEPLMFALVSYFIAGLTRTASAFFIFYLVLWSSANAMGALFRFLACIMPNMVVANAFGALFLLMLTITNGFSIIASSIPAYLIWIYWGLNPMAYSIRALCINELTAPRWGPAGPVVLDSFGMPDDTVWIWIAVGFNWGYIFVVTIMSAMALTWTHPPSPQPNVPVEEQKEEMQKELFNYIRRVRVDSLTESSSTFSPAKSLKAIAARSKRFLSSTVGADPSGPLHTESDLDGAEPLPQITVERVPGRPEVTAERADGETPPSPSSPSRPAVTAKREGVVVPFVPITLSCRDICYYVNDPSGGTAPNVIKDSEDKEIAGKLRLLNHIDFYACPGQLVALMGGSGAGKTTLMDVVAGRKTQGVIRGEILVNGRPKVQETWSRVVGYVEQMDIHSARLTVKESLAFSARLRLNEAEVSDSQVAAIVEHTLDTVELRGKASSIVGEPGADGLSIEQRKRLSIAVEMVANPSVMFMDEPTSGLDARAAAIVMRAVRNVANSNRTVVVTVHQPSMEIFEAFDQLVLMQKGGRLTYFGPLGCESSDLIAYLQSYPGVDPIQPGHNPATWMLEVTGGSMATTFKAAELSFPDAFEKSELRQVNLKLMGELAASSSDASEPLAMTGLYATCSKTQLRELLKKYFAYYWRAPHYNFVRIAMTLGISLVYGLVYLNEGKAVRPGAPPAGVDTVQNIMGLTFSMAIFNGMFNCMTVIPIMSSERTVFYRERAAAMYAPRILGFAQGVAELPYLAVQAFVMVIVSYWMVGFQAVAWKFFFFLLLFFLTLVLYTYLGQLLVFATPNPLLAQLCAAFLNQIFSIFNGFLVPYPQTPAGWKWLNRLSPTSYILEGLAGSQMADSDVPFEIAAADGTTTIDGTVGDFVGEFFGYDENFVFYTPLIVLAYVVAFRTGTSLLLSYVSFHRR